jgi:FkbM family methyltransferase
MLHVVAKTPMRITVPGFGAFNIRPGTSDLKVVNEVFCKQDYDLSRCRQHCQVLERYEEICRRGETPVVIDAGANIGAASIWFASRYPEAQVLAVEPDPENAARCSENTRTRENIVVIEAAIGSSSGAVRLTNPGGASWSVRTQRCEAGGDARICTIQELVESVPQGRLLIVKIDIEGFESDLFSANTSWIDDTAVIVIEPHDWMLPGKKTSSSFQKVLGRRDFEIVLSGENLIYFNT